MSKHPNSTPLNTVFYNPKSKIQNQKSSHFQPRVHGVPFKICAGCANFRKLTAEAQRARSKKFFLVKIHSELCELRTTMLLNCRSLRKFAALVILKSTHRRGAKYAETRIFINYF